ncbi:hypothetical protein [Caldisphaera sp.]|uniref:hypothetical protein n=1 Tax=Caldisphaera sp. TaxID=2060322 RepID=UPI0025C05423|nr:hypothetical protein [Caldisphaera sp.]
MDILNKGIEYLLGFLTKLDIKTVNEYIEKDKSLVPLLDKSIKENVITIIKFILRGYWNQIDKYLHNPDLIISIINKKRPDIAQVLRSEKGRKWLIKQLREIYEYLYNFTWR